MSVRYVSGPGDATLNMLGEILIWNRLGEPGGGLWPRLIGSWIHANGKMRFI